MPAIRQSSHVPAPVDVVDAQTPRPQQHQQQHEPDQQQQQDQQFQLPLQPSVPAQQQDHPVTQLLDLPEHLLALIAAVVTHNNSHDGGSLRLSSKRLAAACYAGVTELGLRGFSDHNSNWSHRLQGAVLEEQLADMRRYIERHANPRSLALHDMSPGQVAAVLSFAAIASTRGDQQRLHGLDLRGCIVNQWDNTVFSALAACTALQQLFVSLGYKEQQDVLANVASVTSLRSLTISNPRAMSVCDLSALVHLTQLDIQCLGGLAVPDRAFCCLTGLQVLQLDGVTANATAPLSVLLGLRRLSLHSLFSARARVGNLGDLSGLTALSSLKLHHVVNPCTCFDYDSEFDSESEYSEDDSEAEYDHNDDERHAECQRTWGAAAELLPGLSTLAALEELELCANEELTLDCLEYCCALPRLRNLRLHHLPSSWPRTSLQALAHLTQLRVLHIDLHNGLDNWEQLASLSCLTSLTVSHLYRSAPLVSPQPLERLNTLNLHVTYASELAGLKGMSSLRQLALSGLCFMTTLTPQDRVPRLQQPLSADNWADEFAPLRGLTQLTRLELRDCESLFCCRGLEGFVALRHLRMGNACWLHDIVALAALTQLHELELTICANVCDLAPLVGMQQLERLSVTHSHKLTCLQPLSALVQLRDLCITGCKGICDLQPLSGLTRLAYVDLSHCEGVRDLAPVSRLVRVRVLNLSCTGITDISPLSELRSLRQLGLRMCVEEVWAQARALPRPMRFI